MASRLILVVFSASFLVGLARAQDDLTKEQKELLIYRAKQNRGVVQQYLKSKGEVVPPPVVWLENGDVRMTFPHFFFYIVRYPSFPDPQTPAKGLKQSNIVAVHVKSSLSKSASVKGGPPRPGSGAVKSKKVTLLASTKALTRFFKNQYVSPSGRLTPEEAAAVLHAWLRLSRELNQDGYYRFLQSIDYVERRGSGIVPQVPSITGKAIVSTGGKGQIQVTIDFNTIPRVVRVLERNTMRPGRRPRR